MFSLVWNFTARCFTSCVLQFVADAKLLYDIDVVRLGTRLLRLLEALLRETASRSDVKDDIQKFHSDSEDVGEEERNGICTYKLSCTLYKTSL